MGLARPQLSACLTGRERSMVFSSFPMPGMEGRCNIITTYTSAWTLQLQSSFIKQQHKIVQVSKTSLPTSQRNPNRRAVSNGSTSKLNSTAFQMLRLVVSVGLVVMLHSTISTVKAAPQYRSSYAPKPVNYPSPNLNNSEQSDILLRSGDNNSNTSPEYVDNRRTNMDERYLKWVSQLPENKQPFWYINMKKINQQIGIADDQS